GGGAEASAGDYDIVARVHGDARKRVRERARDVVEDSALEQRTGWCDLPPLRRRARRRAERGEDRVHRPDRSVAEDRRKDAVVAGGNLLRGSCLRREGVAVR